MLLEPYGEFLLRALFGLVPGLIIAGGILLTLMFCKGIAEESGHLLSKDSLSGLAFIGILWLFVVAVLAYMISTAAYEARSWRDTLTAKSILLAIGTVTVPALVWFPASAAVTAIHRRFKRKNRKERE
jgi:hypothetical protein